MKHILWIIFIISFKTACAQTFEFKDSVFHTNDILRKQILFDYSEASIKPAYIPFLDSLANFLLVHKNLTIEIGNHCDERWSPEYSICLTCKRAQAITDYLISKGIDKNRLSAKGYNADKPIIVHAKTEEHHQVNRRTEFKIVRTDYPF